MPRWCLDVLLWWSAWRKASRSHWYPGAGKVRTEKLLSKVVLQDLWRLSGSATQLRRFWSTQSPQDRETSELVWIGLQITVACALLLSSPRLSLRQLKLHTMTWTFLFTPPVPFVSVWVEATPANLLLLSFVQMGGQFPLTWLSSQPTWWLGTQGAIMLACMSAGPTSPRPESLSSRPPSFTFLVWCCSENECADFPQWIVLLLVNEITFWRFF